MKTFKFGSTSLEVPAIVLGCMRFSNKTKEEMNSYIHFATENGVNFFDHANIYGGGRSEELFGEAFVGDKSLKREDVIIQSKCSIRKGFYDQSKEHILESVDASLKRLQTDYLDVLLLHRPDALVEPEEVAEAFDILEKSGKVRHFGVSNHKPMQIELLKKCVKQPIVANQMQFALPVSNMVANGMEVNMLTDGAIDRDGSVLDYCRLKDITIQAWSPFQSPLKKGCYIGSENYEELNKVLRELSEKYNTDEVGISTAWIVRHPANMQVIAGTGNSDRLEKVIEGAGITLTREEWYRLYLAAGHPLP